jgi:hypothetical protein
VFRQVIAIRWAEGISAVDEQGFLATSDAPLHQQYLREKAAKVVGERVILQHDWTPD